MAFMDHLLSPISFLWLHSRKVAETLTITSGTELSCKISKSPIKAIYPSVYIAQHLEPTEPILPQHEGDQREQMIIRSIPHILLDFWKSIISTVSRAFSYILEEYWFYLIWLLYAQDMNLLFKLLKVLCLNKVLSQYDNTMYPKKLHS